jgi:hypothetical protein
MSDAPQKNSRPDFELPEWIRQEINAMDADRTSRRMRYHAFIETIKSLEGPAQADAWLTYISKNMNNFSDQEALVYLMSRAVPCDAEVESLIEMWKAGVRRSRDRYATDPISFDRNRGIHKASAAKRPDQMIEIAEIPPWLLPNFWGFSDNEELMIDATMLRTVEWCQFGGYDEWWTRLANDGRENVLRGGVQTLPGSDWLFHMCRSNLAISLMGNTLQRCLESIEISENGLAVPWVFSMQRKEDDIPVMRQVEHIPVACSMVFCRARLVGHDGDEALIRNALVMILRHQQDDGSWRYWADDSHPSVEATAFAIHALAIGRPLGWERACKIAREWLWSAQDADGCWCREPNKRSVYLSVLVLDAIELSHSGDQTTFNSPYAGIHRPMTLTMTRTGKRRFSVALSFPGELRTKVEGVAKALVKSLNREGVFYDKWYEAELARLNLDVYLQEIYHKDSDLVVVFVCPEYDKKDWCGLEWRAIRDLIKQRSDVDIMFVKIGAIDLKGLFSIDGYVDGTRKSPTAIAELILQRVANPAI